MMVRKPGMVLSTCLRYGGSKVFGFDPLQIGNKSLRSGAAMALFMTNHTPDKIMMVGRWRSLAFLDYIRPQVLELSHDLTHTMIRFNRFLDLNNTTNPCLSNKLNPDPDPDPDSSKNSTRRPLQYTDNGRANYIPPFNMSF